MVILLIDIFFMVTAINEFTTLHTYLELMKIIFLGLLILISQAGSAQNTIEYSTIDLEKVYSGDEVDTPARFQDGKEDFPEFPIGFYLQ